MGDLVNISKEFEKQIEQEKSSIHKEYSYTDESGKLLYRVDRIERKGCKPSIAIGETGNPEIINSHRRILYQLPKVIEAKEVLIVEDEKSADALNSLGFTATTSPVNAHMWNDKYYFEKLKDKHIVLIPYNSDDSRKYMNEVASYLNENVSSLKMIELPDQPEKGGVSNFIESFKSTEIAEEQLSVLIKKAAHFESSIVNEFQKVILTATEFCKINCPVRKELLFPWLKENSINLVSGWRGCGKTWFALAILDAITKGASFGPWECRKSVPCLFLDGEMTVQDDKERIESLNLNSPRKSALYIYSDAYANQYGLKRANLADESWRKVMKQILITNKIELWVIDNLASLASGLDENSKKEWDPINSWLLDLRFAGISTIMLHHVNKEGGQRGTSAREDNLDISILLKVPPNYKSEDGARFAVKFHKSRVQTKYLNFIGDTELKLFQDNKGKYLWEQNKPLEEKTKEILEMLDQGLAYKKIIDKVGYSSTSIITKIKKKAIEDGLLTDDGKLTLDGLNYIKS